MTPPVQTRIEAILNDRLESRVEAPLAVAFSGGGDSLALLLIAADWARRHGRRLIALTVDHGLRAESADWARACLSRAEAAGLEHRTLVWRGDKPVTGLPAAARAARHSLLAEATRKVGASVLLMGHTADDRIEGASMRADGSTTPDPRIWAPSPVWPEGRDVFLFRPMLGEQRACLRDWLRERGEVWIEDPANEDLRFARARARKALLQAGPDGRDAPDVSAEPDPARLALPEDCDLLWRAGVLRLAAGADGRAVAAAMLCAAGTARPPRGDRLGRAIAALKAGEVATLAGARAWRDDETILVCRESGELRRRPPADLVLSRGGTGVWDGRFELSLREARDGNPLRVRALAGAASKLPPGERQVLKRLPAAARSALPLVTDGAELWTCPILAASPFVGARALALSRLEAALGHHVREGDVAKCAGPPYL